MIHHFLRQQAHKYVNHKSHGEEESIIPLEDDPMVINL